MDNTKLNTNIDAFIAKWSNRGQEDEDDRSYWIDILERILGITNATDHIEFQKKVLFDDTTKRIDAYIPETKVLIEQKSLNIPLDKKGHQSDGEKLTPFEQADRYNNKLKFDERARWIVTSNFSEIWIYDMNKDPREREPIKINILNLSEDYYLLDFLVNQETKNISQEVQLCQEAGTIIGDIYKAFLKQYDNSSDENALKSLNKLCVRIVFCYYAEDAGIFGSKNMFHNYLAKFTTEEARSALEKLFKTLDQTNEERLKENRYFETDYPDLAQFPYVDGGLFSDEDIDIPVFTDEIFKLILNGSNFNWNKISPTIFGAMFESTMNPELRHSGGMHYTSVENIHKVIDPLFLDDLKARFQEIKDMKRRNKKIDALYQFQKELGNIKFLDPACGSGNFLTEAYLSLRKIENEVLEELNNVTKDVTEGERYLVVVDPIKVSISQFYGIEINDFAVTVAKTALWIAENQMLKETEKIIGETIPFLPLKSYANIVEGNALRMDWEEVVPKSELNYIMGNPPFVAQTKKKQSQKDDMVIVFGKGASETKQDYVICWYQKAIQYMQNTKIECAFISTNSICQGECVPTFWKRMNSQGAEIQFAYTDFHWDNESINTAEVWCVIVGFTAYQKKSAKKLYNGSKYEEVKYINSYLIPTQDIWVVNRTNKPQNGMPKMTKGSEADDDRKLRFTQETKDYFIEKYPELSTCIHPYIGGQEYIDNPQGTFSRYCFWFKDVSPTLYSNNKELVELFKKIRKIREDSPTDRINKKANVPYLFCQDRQPDSTYLVFPQSTTSERDYIPIGFMEPDVIIGNGSYCIPDLSLYYFGILTSCVHMTWTKAICGREGIEYRYAPFIYNNFPWPNSTQKQRESIEKTAQGILDARAKHPECSLAVLYNRLIMPEDLSDAHKANDRAVMSAYGWSSKDKEYYDEDSRVITLFNLFQVRKEKH